MLNSQALVQQIEQSCKGGSPDVMEVVGQFDQLRSNIDANTATLLKIKAEA